MLFRSPRHSDIDDMGPPILCLGKYALPPMPVHRNAINSYQSAMLEGEVNSWSSQKWPIFTKSLELALNPFGQCDHTDLGFSNIPLGPRWSAQAPMDNPFEQHTFAGQDTPEDQNSV